MISRPYLPTPMLKIEYEYSKNSMKAFTLSDRRWGMLEKRKKEKEKKKKKRRERKKLQGVLQCFKSRV